jgi:adenosylhomocysteine nucleosidase
MKIVLVASDAREFSGVLSRAARIGIQCPEGLWARGVRLGSHQLLLAANGAGMDRAAKAVDACVARWAPDAVVSFGYCGAVDPALAIADIVVATVIQGPAEDMAAGSVKASGGFRGGPVRSIERIAQTAAEKRRWRAAGAIAVEMEAAGIAERARALGLPFYCIRAVSDLAGEDLLNDFNAALRPDGRFATMALLTGALRRPLIRFPELARLRSRCARASDALGGFIADCGF